MKARKIAIAGMLMLAVTACDPNAPAEKAVSGTRDDVKKVAAVQEKSHRTPKYKSVCARKVDGKCKSYKSVRDGYKKVIDRQAKAAVYCVELDNVNGSAKDDNAWFTVTAVDYSKALYKAEDEDLKFKPIHSGCW